MQTEGGKPVRAPVPSGDEIRARRVALGLSRAELARFAHMSRTTVYCVEGRLRPARDYTLGRLDEVLRRLEEATRGARAGRSR